MSALSGPRLQQAAREAAEAQPGVSRSRPFVDKLDVFKVAGKVFLIVTDDPAEPVITVKCDPERGRALQLRYESVTPGRYLDKTHWTTAGPGPGVTRKLVRDLVTDSYDLVTEALPRRLRPDPRPGS
ncbi:MmcQ/YjbR family DNA-binding protein [Glycomyces sp. NPDC048151]|uniref:MmcQ/YjbR family DNA-binding protein n=1 Tax=Glycomyces sp. NPDC048151 TaxID=3364002 RepID=UPI00371BB7CC